MPRVVLTKIQSKALEILKSSAKYIMLYGGSQSGKTRIILEWIVRMCLHYPGMRAIATRAKFAHAKASLWQQTLQEVLDSYRKKYPDENLFELNQTDHYVKFANGSLLFIAGLDDKERTEKILGRGFAIIYFNECSQIRSTTDYRYISSNVFSRLSQKIKGFDNKFVFDENPPEPTHWTHKMFIEHADPVTDEPLANPELYKSMRMNPLDNVDNLTESYIETLEAMPERERRRFLYGEFVAQEGAIFDNFHLEDCKVDVNDIPKFEDFVVGIDNTGNNLAAVLFGFTSTSVYALDEIVAYRENHTTFNNEVYRKWVQYNYVAYCDPAAGALNDYIWNAQKTDNAVEPSINVIRELIETGNFFVVTTGYKTNCTQLVRQIQSYRLDDKGRIVKVDDHAVDAMRYAIYNRIKYGSSILLV